MHGSPGMDLEKFIEKCQPIYGDVFVTEFGQWRYISSRVDGVPPSLRELQSTLHLFGDLWENLPSEGWEFRRKNG